MAVVFGGAATEQQLVLSMQDFRGQKTTVRIPLIGAVTDADVIAIVTRIDALTNAKILSAKLESFRGLTGYKGAAANALERNISECMELTWIGTNANAKKVERTITVPAMVAALELVDGSPDVANADLAALITLLNADLAYVNSAGAIASGLTFSPAESHHITKPDIVDAL